MAMQEDGGAKVGQPGPSTPLELNSAALQLAMKWLEHASEASELAVSDTRMAEAQARAIGQFFNVVRNTIKAGFAPEPPRDEPKRAAQSPESSPEAPAEDDVASTGAPSVAPAV